MSDKAIIEKIEPYKYNVPVYTVVEGEGIKLVRDYFSGFEDNSKPQTNLYIQMLRGSKLNEENKLEKYDGVLVEQLIAVAIDHLKSINVGELATRETSVAITKLEEAGLWLLKRELDRKRNNTLGTYQK